jgi:hypothetical protein
MTSDHAGVVQPKQARPRTALRARFWAEVVLGSAAGFLFLLTLVWRDWIEAVFHISPDHGNGSVEWLIVSVLAAASVTLFGFAGAEWRIHTRRPALEANR